MSRAQRRFFRIVILVGPLLFLQAALAFARPNLVVFAVDTLRADRLSCYGHNRPTSPNIDWIAERGVRFDHAVATAPWTLPSFASLFTGRYPTRHGAGLVGPTRNLGSDVPRVLSAEATTLAEVLREAGYQTGAVVTNPYLSLGLHRGFDHYRYSAMAAPQVGVLARSWLASTSDDEPFFLLCHFNDPHEPTDAATPYLRAVDADQSVVGDPQRRALQRWGSDDAVHLGRVTDPARAADALRTKLALYDANILEVDYEIGRVLRQLDRQGQLENTLVVVVSDHGEEFLEHAEEERLAGVDPRGIWGIGHGHSLFREVTRVPLILMGPGLEPMVPTVVPQQISLVDFMPTALALLGVESPDQMDGTDRVSWLQASDRESLPAAVESMAYGPDWIAYSDGHRKVITSRTGDVQWAFDTLRDPAETNDLSDQIDVDDASLNEALVWSDLVQSMAPPPPDLATLDAATIEALKMLGYVQ